MMLLRHHGYPGDRQLKPGMCASIWRFTSPGNRPALTSISHQSVPCKVIHPEFVTLDSPHIVLIYITR